MWDVERQPTDDRNKYQKGWSFEKNIFAVQTLVKTNAQVSRHPQLNQNFVQRQHKFVPRQQSFIPNKNNFNFSPCAVNNTNPRYAT